MALCAVLACGAVLAVPSQAAADGLGAGMARGRLSRQRATTWVLHFGGR